MASAVQVSTEGSRILLENQVKYDVKGAKCVTDSENNGKSVHRSEGNQSVPLESEICTGKNCEGENVPRPKTTPSFVHESVESLHKIIEVLHKDLVEANSVIRQLRTEKANLIEEVEKLKYRDSVNASWSEVTSRQRKAAPTIIKENPGTNTNRFSILCEVGEEQGSSSLSQDRNLPMKPAKKKVIYAENVSKKVRKEKKVKLFGDSHGRGLSTNLSELRGDSEVSGFIKPGAPLSEVVKPLLKNADKLSSNDVTIIIGGSNDVARNEGHQAASALKKTLGKLTHTNVIVTNVPHRYDLPDWSIVNRAVKDTNEKFKQICTHFRNVTLLDISKLNRTFHTTHGMHLNVPGKQFVSRLISNIITSKKQEKIILELPSPGNLN